MTQQLKDDYITLFSNIEEYKGIIIKEQYEKYPKISYPMITISEIDNEDVNRFHDDMGEMVSYLTYVIEINAKQNETHTALQNVDEIGKIIDGFMNQDRYKAMRRIGGFPKKPMKNDDNVMIGYLTYECNLDIRTNTIYRRY